MDHLTESEKTLFDSFAFVAKKPYLGMLNETSHRLNGDILPVLRTIGFRLREEPGSDRHPVPDGA